MLRRSRSESLHVDRRATESKGNGFGANGDAAVGRRGLLMQAEQYQPAGGGRRRRDLAEPGGGWLL